MSIILSSADGRDLQVNAWNRGVLHLVANAGIFPEDYWDPMRHNLGGEIDAKHVEALAGFLASNVLPLLREGERMFFNGETTSVPDDGTFYRAEADLWKNYSLRRDVLVSLIDFLRQAKAPVNIF